MLLFLLACGTTPTPQGTVVLDHPFGAAPGEPATSEVIIQVGDEDASEVTLTLQTAGGQAITHVKATVTDANGWILGTAGVGNPVNAGTAEAPVMAVPVLLTRRRETGCSSQATTQSIQLKADGTVLTSD